MKTRLSCTAAVLLCSFQAAAQTVSGVVVDTASNPVEGAVVVSLTGDSRQTGITATDKNGRFGVKTEGLPCRLVFRHIAYEEHSCEAAAEDVGKIVLAEASAAVSEVVVKGNMPTVKIAEGRLLYGDIGRLTEGAAVSNAYEAVSRLPGIYETGDKLFIAGSMSAATIILNGRPTSMPAEQLTNLLKSTPVERVEKVEAAYDAPPRWHSKGPAINIVLKRDDKPTTSGQVQGVYTRKRYDAYDGTANLHIARPRFSLDFMAKYIDFKNAGRRRAEYPHAVGDRIYDITIDTRSVSDGRTADCYGAFEYYFDKSRTLSLYYYGSFMPSLKDRAVTGGRGIRNAESSGDTHGAFHGAGASFQTRHASIGADYGFSNQHQNTGMLYDELPGFDYRSRQRVNRLRVYADVGHELPRRWRLSYGGSFYTVGNSGRTSYEFFPDADIPALPDTDSELHEYSADIYATVSRGFANGAAFSATVKGDYYDNGHTELNFFPGLYFIYPVSADHILQLSVSSQKNYPSYRQMQDYATYENDYILQCGNPDLKPAKYYGTDLVYVLKNRYIFRTSYYYVNDYIATDAFQKPGEPVAVVRPYNIDKTRTFTLTAVVPFGLGRVLSSQLAATLRHARFKTADWFGTSYDNGRWDVAVNWNNVVKISSRPAISLTVDGMLLTPCAIDIYRTKTTWYVNAGLKYSFLRDRAVLILKCNDIFQSFQHRFAADVPGQHYFTKQPFYTRELSVSFTYKFGGYEEKRPVKGKDSRLGTVGSE